MLDDEQRAATPIRRGGWCGARRRARALVRSRHLLVRSRHLLHASSQVVEHDRVVPLARVDVVSTHEVEEHEPVCAHHLQRVAEQPGEGRDVAARDCATRSAEHTRA
jgi:hypothetical protein